MKMLLSVPVLADLFAFFLSTADPSAASAKRLLNSDALSRIRQRNPDHATGSATGHWCQYSISL